MAGIAILTAVFSGVKIRRISDELAFFKKELLKKQEEEFKKLDSNIERLDNNILSLRKDGYIEPDGFSSISRRIIDSTVVVSNSEGVDKLKSSGNFFVKSEADLGNAGTGFFIKDSYPAI